MDRRLLSYYNRELAHLREMGAEFAREFPKIAGRLALEDFSCADPYVERLNHGGAPLVSTPLTDETIAATDCVLILTHHQCLPWEQIVAAAPLIVDTRNALRGYREAHIVRL